MLKKTPSTAWAVFAGGCFWCTESDFEKVDGVIEAISGYTGGHVSRPSYKQVSAGGTGHIEAIKVIYNPSKVTYEKLLEVFWRHVDPTDPGGQFADRGSQYVSAIFYAKEQEKRLAEASKKRLAESGRFEKAIATVIRPVEKFYPAEKYHQDYYKKNPLRYKWYRFGSGRDQFLKKAWTDKERDMKKKMKKEAAMDPGMKTDMSGDTMKSYKNGMIQERTQAMPVKGEMYRKPDDAELKKRLTSLQYQVTQKNGTEPPFDNAFWDNKRAGRRPK